MNDSIFNRNPVIYHTNDPELDLKLSKEFGQYPESTKWLWGNIITNKQKRTDERFAILFDPNGEKVHWLTKRTFIHFFCRLFVHKYIDKARIKVFLTKEFKFRARVEEPNCPPYEVTIGGESWKNGKGLKYKNKIVEKIQQISMSIGKTAFDIVK